MSTILRFPSLLPILLLVAACGRDDTGQQADATPDTSQAADTGMPAMPGMQSGGMSNMMTQMQAHMQAIQGLSADSAMAMLPQHRQLVANMIAQMNREMRDMNMPADTAWNATVDSLRQDLTHMPEMSAQELHDFMSAHVRRVNTVLEMHRRMMGGMRM